MSVRRGLLLALIVCGACRGAAPGDRASPGLPAPAASVPVDELEERARTALDRGRDAPALTLVDEALRRAESARPVDPLALWRARALKAEVQRTRGERRKALDLLAPAPPGAPARLRARALLTEALTRCQLGEDARAVDALFDAAEEWARQDAGDTSVRAQLHRCSCSIQRRDFAAAERLARGALDAARAREFAYLAASAAGNLGVLRMQTERYDAAVDWLGRALDYARASGNGQMEVKTLLNLAICDLMLAETGRALARLQRGIELARSGRHDGELARLLLHAGIAHQAQGEPEAAEGYFRQALGLARDDAGIAAQALNHQAELALARGRLADAERLAREALARDQGDSAGAEVYHSRLLLGQVSAARGAHQEAVDLLRGVAGDERAERNQRWQAHARLAAVLSARGQDAEAEKEFRSALATVEEGRGELRASETRIAFLAAVRRFQDDYVDFLAARGRTAEALEVGDHSRARQLLDGRRPALRVADFQAAARRWNASLVSYWLSPRQAYVWAVDGRRLHARTPPASRDEICRLVDEYQTLLLSAQDPRREGRALGRRLYDLLVGPVVTQVARPERLVLVLDGCLHQLNLETLLSGDGRFLVEDATVIVAPSLGALGVQSAPPSSRPARGAPEALLIGAPAAAPGFPALPQAPRELRDLAALFPPGRVETLSGADARPDAYAAARPERFAYIHFAAHATPNRDSPLDSAVILSPRGDDYKLYAREIVQVPLRADLVVLSACHGAGARAYFGEGLVGLAWAFLAAGARNVVAGLWNVEDNSTAELMQRMYAGLRAGQAPADALRAAKLALLGSDSAYRKPFYWAPFQVYTRAPSPAAARP